MLIRFRSRVLLFAAIQGAVLALFSAFNRVDSSSYLSMSARKQSRLRAVRPPRILLVGGSAVAFGFHSPTIERSFNRPVVNLGLQGSLGLSVKLNEVMENLGRDDWVVLSLEYEHYTGTIREGLTLWGWLEQDWSRWRYLSWDDRKAVVDAGHLYIRKIATTAIGSIAGHARSTTPPYDPASFNVNGDVVGHRDLPRKGFAGKGFETSSFRSPRFEPALDTITEFLKAAADRGARVFIYFPPVPRSVATRHATTLNDLSNLVGQRIGTPLNRARDVFWDDSEFFDTVYHLTWHGQAANTALLIECLGGPGIKTK
jgi:hypothetical protein